uniref:mitogen-activated protein kinase kinase kinase 1-like isoform X6 n=1 Tax=Fragaria vesca subsp. vesca TaxID=101020 RepID=UPI0005CB00A5|nr:PREDICTED: mitogen-activated protein kinase kinase kinase 1-like isoform X6 [Fragaria vesca subsp. vesca]
MHQVETILKAMNPAAKIRKTKLGAVDISPKTWTKGRLLGRGSFGSVYQAYSSRDGFVFAAKEVSLLDQESPGRSRVYQLQQEIEFLSWLEHKNIIQYYGSFEYGSNLYMCMEHAPNGSIRRLYQGSNLSYPRVSKYTKEILLGLNYLHGHNVVHRDIKCANILVDAYGSAKLADFGLAKITTKMNELQSLQGTAFWMAPEVLSAKMKNQGYGSPADIWSLGCTVLEMLTSFRHFSRLQWGSSLTFLIFFVRKREISFISAYKLIQTIDPLLLSSYVIHLSRLGLKNYPIYWITWMVFLFR